MTVPTVAIIIPCYDVDDYLDECVQSVVDQRFTDLQIILVDDGSPGRTPELVDAWADADARVQVIHQENAGLGAARNAGVGAADADYLFFLDSDDLLPLDSIERLVASAEETGSDLVSGVAYKFNSQRQWKTAMYRSPFRTDLKSTHLFFEPELLYDHIACSKLFRRDFWSEHGLEFPEGVLFEDIELVTRAHCLARSVDLVASNCYLWRDREEGEKSITQDRARPGSTAARFDALCKVDSYVADNAPEEVWHAHAAKAFSLDVPVYTGLVKDNGDAYLAEFMHAAGALADHASPEGVGRVSELNQLTWEALRRRDVEALKASADLIFGTTKQSLRSTWVGSRHLEPSQRRATRRTELRKAAGRRSSHLRREVRTRLRSAASSAAPTIVGMISRSTSLDDALSKAATIEDVGRRLGRTVGVLPKRSVQDGARMRIVKLSQLELAGTLLGRAVARRDEGYLLDFEMAPVTIVRTVLLHENERIPIELAPSDNGFSLNIDDLRRFGDQATLRPGTWRVIAIDSAGSAWNAATDSSISYIHEDPEAGARYLVEGDASQIVATVESLIPDSDSPRQAQTVIRHEFAKRAASGSRSRAVFYECFYGRSVGCHPRALFETLRNELPDDVEHVFVTLPGFLHAPQGATTTQRWSRRYHELLRTSPLVIANCELHNSYSKADFQTVVQTWHGTPLKRIGLDIDDPKFANKNYQADLAHQVAQWSMMISPTTDTDDIFPRAFAYEGELLRSGSPRNDRLVRNDAAERQAIRQRIGLPDGSIALLFAPTFRDDSRNSAGYRISPQCDLPTLLDALPDNVVVLFRAHTNIRSSDISWRDPRVINVSDYPDAQDLILAGDILVTDYSSMMFDWALTSKPILPFAPDLARYQSVRDFYYNYESVMPRPPAYTSTELQSAIEDAIAETNTDNLNLIDRFAHRDDGAASDRVVAEILRRVDF